MNSKTTKTSNPKVVAEQFVKPHSSNAESGPPLQPKSGGPLWRKLLAGLMGSTAFLLIMLVVISTWFGLSISSTDRFSATLAPLPRLPAVQIYLSEVLAEKILDNTATAQLEKQFLTPKQATNLSQAQAKAIMKPMIESAVNQVVSSPSFDALWTQTIRSLHTQTLAAANSSAPTATIDVRPQVNGLVNLLHDTKLGSLVKAEAITNDAGKFNLSDNQLKELRQIDRNITASTISDIAIAALAVLMTVLIANSRLKAVRNLCLAVAVGMAMLWAALQALGNSKFSLSQSQQEALNAASNTIFAGLKQLVATIGLISLMIAVTIVLLPIVRRRLADRRQTAS